MSEKENIKIAGVAGTFASGQDTVAHYLVAEHGFFFESTSDMVRTESKKRRNSIERPDLHATAEELRYERGPGVLVEMGYEKFLKSGNKAGMVTTGLRSLGEAQKIKELGGIIIFVDAPLEIRYERMKKRARDSESTVSLAEFKKREDAEWHKGDNPEDFNRKAIKEMADFHINNDRDLESFYRSIDEALGLS